MILNKLVAFVCDTQTPPCGYWEIAAIQPHPTLAGQATPLFFSARPGDPSTQWHYSALEHKWFCPRCGEEKRRAEELSRQLASEERSAAASKLQGAGLYVPSPLPQAPAPAQSHLQAQAQVLAPINQVQAPMVVPAQTGNAPIMAPVLAGQPQPAPPQVAPAVAGEAKPVPIEQMPVRFDIGR